MKVAILHEMLIKLGGAERVLQELIDMYPDADVFTLMYDEQKVGSVFPSDKIHCSGPAQWLYSRTKKPRWSLPLMPFSVKKINLTEYDFVISSSSGFAHGIKVQSSKSKMQNDGLINNKQKNGGTENRTKNISQLGTLNSELGTHKSPIHICYCHSPARYLWDATEEVQAELGTSKEERKNNKEKRRNYFKIYILGTLVRILFSWLRRVDLRASQSPDIYIANSCEVQTRIHKYYNRDSVVLWPPVETDRLRPGSTPLSERTHYVVTSALTPFKRVDRVIRVMTKLGLPLKIIGGGDQYEALKKLAGPHVEFLGRLSDEAVTEVYEHARGFLMPQKEDAGIAPIEAMAAGIPVFGLAKGGLLETNIDGVTGRFFHKETDESFEKGFLDFHREIEEGKYDNSDVIIHHAGTFDRKHFRGEFQQLVVKYLKR